MASKTRKQPIGALEVRMRFHQARADVFRCKIEKLERRMAALKEKEDKLMDLHYKHSQAAASERGIIGIMRREGWTHMAVVDGYCKFTKEAR